MLAHPQQYGILDVFPVELNVQIECKLGTANLRDEDFGFTRRKLPTVRAVLGSNKLSLEIICNPGLESYLTGTLHRSRSTRKLGYLKERLSVLKFDAFSTLSYMCIALCHPCSCGSSFTSLTTPVFIGSVLFASSQRDVSALLLATVSRKHRILCSLGFETQS